MTNEKFLVEGFAHWASALINADYSGVDEFGRMDIDAWRRREGVAEVHSCGEEFFGRGMLAHGVMVRGTLVEYVVTLRE